MFGPISLTRYFPQIYTLTHENSMFFITLEFHVLSIEIERAAAAKASESQRGPSVDDK